jgi:hypothetical protein
VGLFVAVVLIWFIATLFIGASLYKKSLLEFFPSLSWFSIMVIPFIVQYESFPELARINQALAVAIFSVGILGADYFAYRRSKLIIPLVPEKWNLIIAKLLFMIVLGGILSHLILMEKIPLWEAISMKEVTPEQLVEYRENSSKFLKVPLLLKYFFNWCGGLLPLIAAYIFLRMKKYFFVILTLALVVPYTLATTAKMLFFNFFLTLGMILVFEFLSHRKREIKQILAVLSAAVLWFSLDLYRNPESLFNLSSPTPEKQSVGDLLRIHLKNRKLPFSKGSTFLEMKIYRILVVPAEVSNRWYEYYLTHELEGWSGLTLASRKAPNYVHPANKIGIWAYQIRFPDSYTKSCHAYSSIDADAYAHFGFMGVFWFVFILGGIRVLFALLHTNNAVSRGVYYCAITTLGLNCPIASLQAILFPQGIAVLIFLMSLVRFFPQYGRLLNLFFSTSLKKARERNK